MMMDRMRDRMRHTSAFVDQLRRDTMHGTAKGYAASEVNSYVIKNLNSCIT